MAELGNLVIAVDSTSVPQATASLKSLSTAAQEVQASTDSLAVKQDALAQSSDRQTASVIRNSTVSRMSTAEREDLIKANERLIVKQDAYLQSLDRQAATMGRGAVAMRAYKAEQLGLTDSKIFQNLNGQIADLEATAPSAIDKMATRIEGRVSTMVMRMGIHFLVITAVVNTLKLVMDTVGKSERERTETEHNAWLTVANDIQDAIDKVDEYNTKIGLSKTGRAGIKAYDWEATVAHGEAANAYSEKLQIQSTKNAPGRWADEYEADLKAVQVKIDSALAREKEARAMAQELYAQESLVESKKNELDANKSRDAARDAQTKKQTAWIEALKTEVDTYGMGSEALKRYEQAKVGLSNNPAANKLMAELKSLRDDSSFDKKASRGVTVVGVEDDGFVTTERIRGIEDMMERRRALRAEYKMDQAALKEEGAAEAEVLNLVQPGREQLIKLGDSYEKLVWARDQNLISQKEFSFGEQELLRRTRESLPVMTDMFGNLRDTITDWSKRSTDAFVDFCFTGKNSFGDLISSMLRDLARLAVQRNVMDPLLKWGLAAVGGMFSPAAPATPSGSTFDAGGYQLPGLANGGGGASPSITVNVNSSGAQASVAGGGAAGVDLGQMIQATCDQWAIKNSRQGGLLARA